jgi:uncharacterized protein YdiU (UPF0061 family)
MERAMQTSYRPDPAFLSLGGAPFCDSVRAAAFPAAIMRFRNDRWAARVGLQSLGDEAWTAHFARFEPLPDNLPEPLALRYHGHQFRTYNPDLGDGRGFLFAQLRDDEGRLLDLGTKGSGKTPYSRTADGRLTLKGGVREILATEMLEALGVYTSKTFSVIETGEELVRHDEPSPTRSCVLTRLSHSHVRFGTFQRLAYEGDAEAIRRLIDYCAKNLETGLPHLEKGTPLPVPRLEKGELGGDRHGPDREASPRSPHTDSGLAADPPLAPPFQGGEGSGDPVAFFARVVADTARLAAQWMAAGFVHGVLNTDNMNVTGESFDYGPWRFLPEADPSFTAAYFDQTGLYAYGRQAEACAWNLSRLGGALTLVADPDALNAAFEPFPALYEEAISEAFFRRLGLKRSHTDEDAALVVALLRWMEKTRVPFERVLYDWFCGRASEARAAGSPLAAHYGEDDFSALRALLSAREPERPHRLGRQYFARGAPCSMLIDEVEALWAPIAATDDWAPLRAKLADIALMREAYSV